MTEPVVRVYDSMSFEPMGEWAGLSSVSLAFDEHGPASAEIVLPRASSYLTVGDIMPHGLGVVIEVDARTLGTDVAGNAIGVPDVWLGRADTLGASSQGATCALSCVGPDTWIDQYTVARQGRTRESAGAIAKRLCEQYPGARLSTVSPYYGPGGDTDLGGSGVWSTLTALADNRGEAFVAHVVPGEARQVLRWTHPLMAEDRTGAVTLADNVNVEWDGTYQLSTTSTDLIGIAQSFAAGPGATAASVSAPAATRIGRHAALTATLASAAARNTIEGSDVVIRSEIPTRAELDLVLAAKLRESLVPPLLLQLTVTDPAIWKHLSAGVLVKCEIDDPLDLFSGGAIGRILDRAFDVYPSLACTVGLELWRTA